MHATFSFVATAAVIYVSFMTKYGIGIEMTTTVLYAEKTHIPNTNHKKNVNSHCFYDYITIWSLAEPSYRLLLSFNILYYTLSFAKHRFSSRWQDRNNDNHKFEYKYVDFIYKFFLRHLVELTSTIFAANIKFLPLPRIFLPSIQV